MLVVKLVFVGVLALHTHLSWYAYRASNTVRELGRHDMGRIGTLICGKNGQYDVTHRKCVRYEIRIAQLWKIIRITIEVDHVCSMCIFLQDTQHIFNTSTPLGHGFFGPTRHPAVGTFPTRGRSPPFSRSNPPPRAHPMWIHVGEWVAVSGWAGGRVGRLPNPKCAALDDVSSVYEHVTFACHSETPTTRGKATFTVSWDVNGPRTIIVSCWWGRL